MGCGSSKTKRIPQKRRSVATADKVQEALRMKKEENRLSQKPLTFDKVLLKFYKISLVIGYVKKIFNKMAKDGKLDHAGLQATMERLDVHMDLQETLGLFDFVDLESTNYITMKEFFVALTVGVALDAIPAFCNTPSVRNNGDVDDSEVVSKSPKIRKVERQFSTVVGHEKEIKEILTLVINTFLLFDPEGKGFIDKSRVISIVDEHKHKSSSNAMFSEERWNEMDWDENGQIDFAEFVYAFTSWVDQIQENDEEEEEEE